MSLSDWEAEAGDLDWREYDAEGTNAYAGCAVCLKHGACVCSTGYPASCQAEETS